MDTDQGRPSEARADLTRVDVVGDREIVVTRVVRGPAPLVYTAFAQAERLRRWWVPASFGLTLVSCEADVRLGGGYRLAFQHGEAGEMAFFGRYVEVVPDTRLAWTNDEGGDDGAVTSVQLEDLGDKTRVVMTDRYATTEARDAAFASGEKCGAGETFDQLDALLAALGQV